MMVRIPSCPSSQLELTTAFQGADIDSDELKGIIPRITEQIFQSIVESDSHLEYLVKVSYMEIYLERVRDLLAREWHLSFPILASCEDGPPQPQTTTCKYTRRSRKAST